MDKKEKALQSALSKINDDRTQMEELQNTLSLIKSETPDIVKLNAANESDRIAAQKATMQNTKLKQDIESLQEAYNKMVMIDRFFFVSNYSPFTRHILIFSD